MRTRRKIFNALLNGLLTVLVVVLLGTIFTLIVSEWFVGCGESYVDSKGVRHHNECLFIGGKK